MVRKFLLEKIPQFTSLITVVLIFSELLVANEPVIALEELVVSPNLPDNGDASLKVTERIKTSSVLIDGKQVDYICIGSIKDLVMEDKDLSSSIFSVSYAVRNQIPAPPRPVAFVFNGGPGSSSAWLHLGVLGPKIIPTSKDGLKPYVAEAGGKDEKLIDNPFSILDVADLVFIDAPTTGFSRIGKDSDKRKIHSYKGDVEIMAEFIDSWIKTNDRSDSPKFIIGESYGSVRAIGVCDLLQNERKYKIDGVVLLSGLIDLETVINGEGNIKYYTSHLPSYAMTAHYHGLIKGDIDEIYKKAYQYANNEYRLALQKGIRMTAGERHEVVKNLVALTGLSKQLVLHTQLRIRPSIFRLNAMGRPPRLLGRYDARVTKILGNQTRRLKSFDPSLDMMRLPLQQGMKAFLTEMQWTGDEEYRLVTNRVKPWDYGVKGSQLNLSKQLETSLSGNDKLKVLIQCGRYDLATPPAGIQYSINQLKLSDEQRRRISVSWYEAGHMFYFKQASLDKSRNDLIQFIVR